ncbi:50S ribosomal protein L4 [Candidatus Mycoplasma haematobovis]|uniref:Large ribosomal subunit protein uL4 n=1 Tax=Candidatus Mycoplasma haematobovis TaxID=432608 RepID=A0A1A9QEI3_9MOLU|nr:50S ribosomal protein L4 [Candidatus Mycoplasma haematobovis]OAL10365.1 50S ribosomal protein L4 [Candidatus Mycoplasma haematobovis]
MKEVSVISIAGEKKSSLAIPKQLLWPENVHGHSIFEAVNTENQNRRQGTHDTKNKSEVSGTGKKPYRQKHTGRARQGSRRNPQFRGGGVAFGVTPEKNYLIKTNKKVGMLAFVSAWKRIFELEMVSVLEEVEFKKTKEFSEFLKKANLNNKKLLLIDIDKGSSLYLASKNIANLVFKDFNHCSVRDLINTEYILLTKGALETVFNKLEKWK